MKRVADPSRVAEVATPRTVKSYKGFTGIIHWDDDSRCYRGVVRELGSEFSAKNLPLVFREFKTVVNGYYQDSGERREVG